MEINLLTKVERRSKNKWQGTNDRRALTLDLSIYTVLSQEDHLPTGLLHVFDLREYVSSPSYKTNHRTILCSHNHCVSMNPTPMRGK